MQSCKDVLNLRGQQLKIITVTEYWCIYIDIYMSLMVITHQKSILNTHTENREKNPSVTLW